jgi:hypothetical protein
MLTECKHERLRSSIGRSGELTTVYLRDITGWHEGERDDVPTQVRYDFAQLYDWYVGPFFAIHNERGLSLTYIDVVRNQLVVGVKDSVAYRRVLRLVETLPIPKGVVRVE